MDELKKSGKTILFVSHDMGSIIKYCDHAIIIDAGRKICEGSAEEMVDIYKKILVNQYGLTADDKKKTETCLEKKDNCRYWKDYMLINPNKEEYGNGNATIVDFGLFGQDGEITNVIRKLDDFSVKMKVRFNEQVENPIFAFTIKDLKGTELCGTNTFIEEKEIGFCECGEIIEITFKQKMLLQNGQYLLLLGCTGYINGELVVYNRLYDICCIQVVSDKITNGYFDVNTNVEIRRGQNYE